MRNLLMETARKIKPASANPRRQASQTALRSLLNWASWPAWATPSPQEGDWFSKIAEATDPKDGEIVRWPC
jgi:hypothetical protein